MGDWPRLILNFAIHIIFIFGRLGPFEFVQSELKRGHCVGFINNLCCQFVTNFFKIYLFVMEIMCCCQRSWGEGEGGNEKG